MDTIIQSVPRQSKRSEYRQHTVEFKRAVVLQSLVEGASVSRIARAHDVNANQVFAWRKAFNEGRLGDTSGTDVKLIPITLAKPPSDVPRDYKADFAAPAGTIELEIGKAKLRIAGSVDETALTSILDRLLR
jgi:transposase